MNPKRLKVIFFPAWYPTKMDSMAGLFVKYHAKAVAQYADVAVLHCIPTNTTQKKAIEYEYFVDEGIPTIITYIQKRENNWTDKILFPIRYITACYTGYNKLIKQFGKPHLHHVHILTRSGLLALYKKVVSGIPYIVTEHWSRYLPQNSNSYQGGLRKWLTKRVVKNASLVTTVSKHLGVAMQSHGLKNQYTQVPNVVNVDFFQPQTSNYKPQTSILKPILLHVSCFDEKPKNVKGILEAAKKLENADIDFELRLVGDGKDWQLCVDYARELGVKNVVFTGLKTGDDLLKEFQTADVFILFSRFENQPVVILEAFACGLPVIATKVGGIPEIVQPGFGLLIESENVEELVNSIKQTITSPQQFDRVGMRNYVLENFSYAGVGKQFYDIYQKVLNH